MNILLALIPISLILLLIAVATVFFMPETKGKDLTEA